MRNPEALRTQAVRLFALAIETSDEDRELADQLVVRAMKLQDEAIALEEAARVTPQAQDTAQQSNVKPQEQVQPEEDED